MIERETSDSGGLLVANNERIQSFLQECIEDPNLNKQLHQIASDLSSRSCVEYRSVLSLWSASYPSTRPKLISLFPASDFIFPSPKPREKGEQLQARLKYLDDLAEQKAYGELVEDITPRKELDPFSSYTDQLGFGLHVVFAIFVGYLMGYMGFGAVFNHSAIMKAVGGIMGLIFALLFEAIIFIVRTSDQSSQSTSDLKKKQYSSQEEKRNKLST